MLSPRIQRDYVEKYAPVVNRKRPRKEPAFYDDTAQVIIGGFVEVEPLERQAVSIYILALILAPNESPLTVLARILTGGFSPDLTILIPLSSLLLLSIVLASMVGVIYFLMLPEMKNYVSGNGRETIAVVLRTLKPEERKVVSVLDANGGANLQKFITKEAGPSRLKTHRVVAALSERGIVHVEVRGNTNEVSLVKWFHDGMHR